MPGMPSSFGTSSKVKSRVNLAVKVVASLSICYALYNLVTPLLHLLGGRFGRFWSTFSPLRDGIHLGLTVLLFRLYCAVFIKPTDPISFVLSMINPVSFLVNTGGCFFG